MRRDEVDWIECMLVGGRCALDGVATLSSRYVVCRL
jgi:hypothetical protein